MERDLPPIDYAELGINTKGRTSGSLKTLCPKCSHRRKKKHEPCLSVNLDKGCWKCHNPECGWTGPEEGYATERGQVRDLPPRYREPDREVAKIYHRPKPPMPAESQTRLDTFFKQRKISPETWQACGIVDDGKSICFPYTRDGELVNVKHRGPNKKFWMESGAELIMWRLDDCAGASTVYVVEGEMDGLAMREAGYHTVLSVPAGAPSVESDIATADLAYLPSAEAVFDEAREVVLCGDMDGPGQRLMDELARRIGREKCWKVAWPEGCKDANDALIEQGPSALWEAVDRRTPYPVDGITSPMDYLDAVLAYREDREEGVRFGMWPKFSNLLRIQPGQLSVWTGVPTSGKSVFLNQVIVQLALQHHWTVGIFSPEYFPVARHLRDMAEVALGKPVKAGFRDSASEDELRATIAQLDQYVRMILPPEPTLDDVLYRAKALVYREGVRFILIDPWTEIDSNRPGNMPETDWIEVCLKRLRRFGRNYGVHVAIVAHPTKIRPNEKDANGMLPVVQPYDISGSRHWYNMSDIICSVWRNKSAPDEPVQVHVLKMKFQDTGCEGVGKFRFEYRTKTYTDMTEQIQQG